jgi:hypothetical protein
MAQENLMRFIDHSLSAILEHVNTWLQQAKVGDVLAFQVPNPDCFPKPIPGIRLSIEGQTYVYRPLEAWFELAEHLNCRCLTPTAISAHLVTIRLQKQSNQTAQKAPGSQTKYDQETDYWLLDKREWPGYVLDFQQSLRLMTHPDRISVLELGCHRGDGYDMLRDTLCQATFRIDPYATLGIDPLILN